jgi:hypothetical protein
VTVLNGAGVFNLANERAAGLAARGFHVTAKGNAPHPRSRTIIEYGAASQLPKANAVAAEFPGAKVKQVTGVSSSSVRLILGVKDNALKPKPKQSAAHKVAGLGTKYGGTTGNATCSSDNGAFKGPLSPPSG